MCDGYIVSGRIHVSSHCSQSQENKVKSGCSGPIGDGNIAHDFDGANGTRFLWLA